jgi:inosine-uridine nucleoside N-ribohydrolase
MDPFEEFNAWIDNLAVPVVLTDELKETIKEQAKALINW